MLANFDVTPALKRCSFISAELNNFWAKIEAPLIEDTDTKEEIPLCVPTGP